MELIKEHHLVGSVKLLNREKLSCQIWAEEFKTFWRMSGQVYGWALPFADGWRYKKKDCKTAEEAAAVFLKEVEQRYNYKPNK